MDAEIIARLDRIERLLARPTITPEFLGTEDAALYLGMSTVTLEQWRCEGSGPAFCKVGRSVRYHVDDLRSFMLERRQRPLA